MQDRNVTKTQQAPKSTVLILGDQINRDIASLSERSPQETRILFVELGTKVQKKEWHVQKVHLLLSAMQHFAEELRSEGYEVDYRRADTLRDGVSAHMDAFDVANVIAMEPMNWNGKRVLEDLNVELVKNNQFLCHYEEFAEWTTTKNKFKMEDFYRWQRKRLDILMDGASPCEGKWNFDHENRERPPRDGREWPQITFFEHDEIDDRILQDLDGYWGAPPKGIWPVTREQALVRLDEFVNGALTAFGPYEDAMLSKEWKLAHSVLSSSLNIGLLHPREVVRAVENAYTNGDAPINSVEGFIRQVIGWREYVWGLYWLWMPEYKSENFLDVHRPIPPSFLEQGETDMSCISGAVDHLHEFAYTHHIERLMLFGNLALTSGINPQEMTEWMHSRFIDGAEWVMLPNVIGMATFADGGKMATKPYASGGAYINKMSDYCRDCVYDPKKRTGDNACPFTTLYWDFLARNEKQLSGNPRMGQQFGGLRRLSDLDEVRTRGVDVLAQLDEGTL